LRDRARTNSGHVGLPCPELSQNSPRGLFYAGGMEPPKLWIVRHGETTWARLGKHTSRTDVALTARGREEALAIGRAIADETFDLVLSSPKRRALDTAKLAGFGRRVETTDDLLEWDYGVDEGRTSAEIREDRPGWTIWGEGPRDGESAREVATRVDRVIARVRAGQGDALAVAHGHILRALTARWLDLPVRDGRLFELGTARISILGWEREQPVIERWNAPATPAPAASPPALAGRVSS
jgi:broad specificity phosphatase PhoE